MLHNKTDKSHNIKKEYIFEVIINDRSLEMLVSNDLLVDIYRNAVERKVNNGLIQTSFNEI